ncbi:MAG TPA: serine/threonine-protein kinase [Methanomicrobiales archaeon]|nr:serine/threonine-protein kinase [Methanomicrobiales archaeon]
MDVAIIGVAALAFALFSWTDRNRPGWTWTASRPESRILTLGHGLLGFAMLPTALLLENALAIRFMRGGEGLALFALCTLLAFLGFSSLGLARASWNARPAPLLNRVHPFLGALVTGIFILLQFDAPKKPFILILALGTLVSTLLAYRQSLGLRPPEGPPYRSGGRDPSITRGSEPPGTSAGPYEVAFPAELRRRFSDPEIIARGGFSRVFSARRTDTGERVAVKVPAVMDEATGRAFLREIRTWEGLKHENILPLRGANILPVPYVEMDYFPQSLADLKKPVDPRAAVRIIGGIARGLAYAHARGVIHRDLKPGNILLTKELEPRIGDWGLSRLLSGGSATDLLAFSPQYAAPEQLDPEGFGLPDERTDIYGLGAIFYELMTGEPPFTGRSIAELTGKILHGTPVPPSEKNPAALPVEGIILRCLAKEPSGRYQSIEELNQDLQAFLPEKS